MFGRLLSFLRPRSRSFTPTPAQLLSIAAAMRQRSSQLVMEAEKLRQSRAS